MKVYRVERAKDGPSIERILNRWAKAGWEPFAVIPTRDNADNSRYEIILFGEFNDTDRK